MAATKSESRTTRWATAAGISVALIGGLTVGTASTAAAQTSYPTPGSYTFVVPAGVSKLKVGLIGGGGGGGAGSSGAAGGNGGYSAYVTTYFDVTPGTSYAVNVAAGGAGGNTPSASGLGGQSSTFSGAAGSATAGGGGGAGGAGIAAGGGFAGSSNGSAPGNGSGTNGGPAGANGTGPANQGAGGTAISAGAVSGGNGTATQGGAGGIPTDSMNAGSGGSGGAGAGGGGGGASGTADSGNNSGGGGGGAGGSYSSGSGTGIDPPVDGLGVGGSGGSAGNVGQNGTAGRVEITALNQASLQVAAGNQELTASWTEPAQPSSVGAVAYQLYADGVAVPGATTSPVALTGLTNGQTYNLSVVATATGLATSSQTVSGKPAKSPQSQPAGAIPKKIKNRGSKVVNKAGAATIQGQPVSAHIRRTRGDITCMRVINGPNRKVTIRTTGRCAVKIRVVYNAPGTERLLAYRKVVTYTTKRVR